ncbi:ATP-binding cassette domain-containing protein, partial [Agromyces albus]
TPRATAAKGAAASTARSRAAAAASSQRQALRVAASLTTETTAAERSRRKATEESPSVEVATPSTAEAPAGRSEIDEETVERAPSRAAAEVTEPARAIPQPEASSGAAIIEPARAIPQPEASSGAAIIEPAISDAIATATEVPTAEVPTAEVAAADVPAAEMLATEVPATEVPTAEVPATAAQAVAVIPVPKKPTPRKKRTLRVARPAPPADAPRVLAIDGLVKRFGPNTAVDGISLDVRAGSFFGLVGPNGAGKTTTLSMVTGLLRPDAGTVRIHNIDAWDNPRAAKRATGVLPDRLRLFDRLTGAQLLYYSGVLRGLDNRTVRERSADLIAAFGLEDAVDRLVADYSAGMTKKIALACAMIHSPRLLVLDEPFESVDPVSAANLTDILERYVAGGGTVVLSSHGMDLIERVCDSAAIIVAGRVLAAGTLDEVRGGQTLEDRFVELAGGRKAAEGMEWLHSFSD